jgi:hypothetical protein
MWKIFMMNIIHTMEKKSSIKNIVKYNICEGQRYYDMYWKLL